MWDINKKEISPGDFSPELLDCRMYISSPSIKVGNGLRQRKTKYYEFELFMGTEGTIFLDKTLIPVVSGDIIFKKPGQITYGIAPHRSLLVFFDVMGNKRRELEGADLYSTPILDKIPSACHPEPAEAYQQLFFNILNEHTSGTYASPLLIKSYLLQLIYNLYFWATELSSKTIQIKSPYYLILKKVINYIQNNCSSKIDLVTLANIAGLSPTYFHKIFTQAMDITPYEYINKIRLDKAKKFLLQTSFNIQEVAERSGFENPSYFSEVFKKSNGTSPREFRKRYSM